MTKLFLLLSFFCLYSEVRPQVPFGKTNIVWTLYNGKKSIAAYLPGDPFRGPRRYGTIPWNFSIKIPYGISYHYEQNILVFSDLSRNIIYQIDTASGSWNSSRLLTGFGWVEHTAVDWLSDNLYWVDAYFEWIAMKPLDSTDPSDFKVIADSSVFSPRGIAVDPNRGYLFWTEVFKPARIIRAEMDGTNQRVIAAQALINPFDLTIKPETGRIYWVDRARDTLETVENTGAGRDVIFTSHQGQPVGLSYYKDHIFVADTNFDDVLVLDTVNGLGKTFFKLNQRSLGIARVLTVWAKENQPDSKGWKGVCKSQKCDQYCVLNMDGKPRCLCQENFELQPDGKMCRQVSSVPHHALVLTNGSHICAYRLNVIHEGVDQNLDCYPEGQSDMDVGRLAVDSRGKAVYYSSSDRSEIRKLNLEDSSSTTFASNVQQVGGMAFDYVEKVLYWSDVQSNEIKKQIENGTPNTVLFGNGLGDVTIDPYHRLLFYIKNGSKPSIMKHDMDDSTQKDTQLTNSHPIIPQRLTYDDKSQTVYWSDLGKLQKVSYDGKASPSVGTLNVNNRAITSYGKYLMWSTRQSNGSSLIHMYKPPDKTTYKRLKLNFPGIVTDFGIFDRMRHDPKRDPCFVRNGGCQHICLPGGQDEKCTCKLGYTLSTDKRSCQSNMVADNYTFAADPKSKRVVQVDFKTGRIAGTDLGEGTIVSNVVVIGQNAYYADQTSRTIVTSNVDGGSKRTIHSTGGMIVQRIAVDPSSENIYYTATNGLNSVIRVINQKGTRAKTLIDKAKFLKDIKLHSKYGIMFWVESKGNIGIERADMNGLNRVLIYRGAANSQIYGIELDYETDMLYWCDKQDGFIRRSDLFGGDVEDFYQDKETSVTDIAILGEFIYYTGTNRNGILAVKKSDGSGGFLLTESHMISQLHDLSVVSKSVKLPVNERCSMNNAQCSSLCLPVNDTVLYVCECRDEDLITDNGKQCARDVHPDLPTPPRPSGPPISMSRNPFIPTQVPSQTTLSPNGSSQSNAQSAEDTSPNPAAIAVPIVLVVLIAVAVIVVVVLYRRRQSKRSPLVSDPRGSENPSYFNGSSSVETKRRNSEQGSHVYTDDADLPTPPRPSGPPISMSRNPFIPTQVPSQTTLSPNGSSQSNAQSAEDTSPNPAAIAVPIVLVVLIAVAVIVVVVLYRRRQSKRSPLVSDPRGSENPSYFNGSSSVETVKT